MGRRAFSTQRLGPGPTNTPQHDGHPVYLAIIVLSPAEAPRDRGSAGPSSPGAPGTASSPTIPDKHPGTDVFKTSTAIPQVSKIRRAARLVLHSPPPPRARGGTPRDRASNLRSTDFIHASWAQGGPARAESPPPLCDQWNICSGAVYPRHHSGVIPTIDGVRDRFLAEQSVRPNGAPHDELASAREFRTLRETTGNTLFLGGCDMGSSNVQLQGGRADEGKKGKYGQWKQ